MGWDETRIQIEKIETRPIPFTSLVTCVENTVFLTHPLTRVKHIRKCLKTSARKFGTQNGVKCDIAKIM
mgnify:CR=1 FL=1